MKGFKIQSVLFEVECDDAEDGKGSETSMKGFETQRVLLEVECDEAEDGKGSEASISEMILLGVEGDEMILSCYI